jgi:hypothetical protein
MLPAMVELLVTVPSRAGARAVAAPFSHSSLEDRRCFRGNPVDEVRGGNGPSSSSNACATLGAAVGAGSSTHPFDSGLPSAAIS